jgi:hypothetical protein
MTYPSITTVSDGGGSLSTMMMRMRMMSWHERDRSYRQVTWDAHRDSFECVREGVCACHDPGDGVHFDCGVGHRVHAAFGSVAWYRYR